MIPGRGAIIMPNNEYMTPEIGNVISMLNQSCNNLTRQDLIRGITAKTQEWVQGDPELADILGEGSKTLEGCVRYVTEKAAFVIAKNINAMLDADIKKLPRAKIQGKEATMAGGAISDEEVYKWAQEYYYDPKAEPKDFVKEAEQKAEAAKRKAEQDKAAADKKAKADKNGKNKTKNAAAKNTAAPKTDSNSEKNPPDTVPTGISKDVKPIVGGVQTSLFGEAPDAEAA
jgi:hypothetical protein